jgi:hypothetical protein
VIGAQQVTYQTAANGALDYNNVATLTYTDTTLYGSLQPMEVKEAVTNIDYAIEKYHFITPPTSVALAAKATDRLVDSQGLTYRVFGAKIKPRANGTPHHVEILLENPSGLNA